jgi:hypothetical protein
MDLEEIRVTLNDPTLQGRLFYYRDPEIDNRLIFIRSDMRRKSIYKVVVGGSLMIGIDNDHLLYYVEAIIPKRFWKVREGISLPDSSSPYDVTFPYLSERGSMLERPFEVLTDPEYQFVHILFGEKNPRSRNIALSEQCFAILNEDILAGFIVKRVDAPPRIYEDDILRASGHL